VGTKFQDKALSSCRNKPPGRNQPSVENGPVRKAAEAVLRAQTDRRVRVAVDIDPLHML